MDEMLTDNPSFTRSILGTTDPQGSGSRPGPYLSLRGEQIAPCPSRLLWVNIETFRDAAATARRTVISTSSAAGCCQLNAADAASENLARSGRDDVRYNRFRPTMLPLPAYPPTARKVLCLRW
jgi:hypothetical protein